LIITMFDLFYPAERAAIAVLVGSKKGEKA